MNGQEGNVKHLFISHDLEGLGPEAVRSALSEAAPSNGLNTGAAESGGPPST
jgi:hypothetical protein